MGIMRYLRNGLPLLVAGLLTLGLSVGTGLLLTVGTNNAVAEIPPLLGDKIFVNNDAGNDEGDGEGEPQVQLVEESSCENPDFNTIQEGIDAASDGDEVRVCGGGNPYAESPQINESITVRSDEDVDLSECDSGKGDAPVVNPPNPQQVGFALLEDDVELRGFVITGADNAPGVFTRADHSGYKVNNNRVEDNTYGMFYNADGSNASTVDNNCFKANNRAGAASGFGILSEQGLSDATIENNELSEKEGNPIALASPDQETLTIKGNSISDNESSAMFVDGGDDLDIDANEVTANGGSGVALFGVTNSRVTNNVIGGTVFDGIRLARTEDAGSQGSTGNRIEDNEITGSGRDGIRVQDDESSSNMLTNNDSRIENSDAESEDSEGFDCRDMSSDGGTAGTANTWTGNIGDTDDPDGICNPAPSGGGGGPDDSGGDDDGGNPGGGNGSSNPGGGNGSSNGGGGNGSGGRSNNDNDDDAGVLPPPFGVLGTANTCGLFRQNFGGPARAGRLALCVAATNRVLGSVAPLVVTPTQACTGTGLSKKRRRGHRRSDYGACVRSIQLTLTGLGRVF